MLLIVLASGLAVNIEISHASDIRSGQDELILNATLIRCDPFPPNTNYCSNLSATDTYINFSSGNEICLTGCTAQLMNGKISCAYDCDGTFHILGKFKIEDNKTSVYRFNGLWFIFSEIIGNHENEILNIFKNSSEILHPDFRYYVTGYMKSDRLCVSTNYACEERAIPKSDP